MAAQTPRSEIVPAGPGHRDRRRRAGAPCAPAPILLLLPLVSLVSVGIGVWAPGPLQEVAWANHGGPEFYVDISAPPSEDTDGDRHFRTLQAALTIPPNPQEYDTIWVDPGRYEGDLVIEVDGIALRSTRGPTQTVLAGTVVIRARDVRVEGFTIEAPPTGTGGVIEAGADGTVMENVRISGGRVGLAVDGAGEVVLKDVQIYNHAQDGLVIKGAWAVKVQGAELRGNGGLGAWVEDSQEVSLTESEVALNSMGGLWLKGVQRALLQNNAIENNDLVGVLLEETTDSQVVGNRVTSGEAGILLLNASGNEVRQNEIQDQKVVGLGLKNRSRGNLVAENLIQGNRGRGAVGLRLVGDVSQNRFENNRIVENGLGLLLGVNDTGGPSGNVFAGNELARSDWVGALLDPGTKNNRFVRNRVYENLDQGLIVGSEGDLFEGNEIFANGGAGMELREARDVRLAENVIYDNGAEGLLLQDAFGVTLADNEIAANVREGVRVQGGRLLRFSSNRIAQNGGDGLLVRGAEIVVLQGNELRANRERGAAFSEARDVVLFGNAIVANGAGGVRLERVILGDIEGNRVEQNLHFGLYVLESEGVAARRNFWGDETGPAGAYAGRGDAVLGLSQKDVTPWLPANPDEMLLRSLATLVVDAPRGPRVQLDATDRLGLVLNIYNPGRGAPGQSELIAEGVIIAGRYAQRPEGAPPLDAEMGFYSITVAGLDAGTAEIEVFYREEEQPPGLAPEKLKLFVLRDGEWVPLPGSVSVELRRVTGEIPVKELSGRLLALGVLDALEMDAFERDGLPTPDRPHSDGEQGGLEPKGTRDGRPEPEADLLPPPGTGPSPQGPPSRGAGGLGTESVLLLTLPLMAFVLYWLALLVGSRRASSSKPIRIRLQIPHTRRVHMPNPNSSGTKRAVQDSLFTPGN